MIHAKSILALTPEGASLVNKVFTDASNAQYSSPSSFTSSVPTGEWKAKEGEKPIGWTYMGSANFTRAAWGNLAGSAARASMSTSNWELGVVLPIWASEVEQRGLEAEGLRAVVYWRPLQAYAKEDRVWDNRMALASL